MPLEIKVPSLGQSVPEATVGEWLVQEGEAVEADQAVVELETDKINMEVTAFKGGTLAEIRKSKGETVAVGEVLGTIAVEGEEAAGAAEEEVAEEEATEEEPAVEEATEEEPAEEEPAPAAARGKTVIPEEMRTSPAVRRLAREHELDLTAFKGTGRGGRVTKQDVLEWIEAAPERAEAPEEPERVRAAPATPAAAEEAPVREYGPDEPVDREPMSPIRKTIAHRMAQSKRTAAHVTTVDEADFGALVELREELKEGFLEEHGFKLTYMPFVAKASIAALKEFPEVNARIADDEIIYHRFYHIGVAVHTEAGLVVPVVKHADRKSIVEIAGEIDDLARRARERELEMDEIQGATFTLTNAGGYGAILSTPIINHPESAVLGIHKIQERPVARNGQVVIRPMMWLGLSYDHRLVDGTPAVLFLRRVCELLEDPERLLIEM